MWTLFRAALSEIGIFGTLFMIVALPAAMIGLWLLVGAIVNAIFDWGYEKNEWAMIAIGAITVMIFGFINQWLSKNNVKW